MNILICEGAMYNHDLLYTQAYHHFRFANIVPHFYGVDYVHMTCNLWLVQECFLLIFTLHRDGSWQRNGSDEGYNVHGDKAMYNNDLLYTQA